MSTGVKKPPVAPKPKLGQPQKALPPPVAPKPDIILSHHSLTALKKAKPVVAPKPCLPKSTSAPESTSVTLNSAPQMYTQERSSSLENLGLLNSRNGMCTELSKSDSNYIISTCTCSQDSCPQCEHTRNCKTTEIVLEPLGECLETCQNSRTEGSRLQISPVPTIQTKAGSDSNEMGSEKGQVINCNFLEQKLKDVWAQAMSTNKYHLNHRPQENPSLQNGKAEMLGQNLNPVGDIESSGRKQSLPERSQSDEANGNISLASIDQPLDDPGVTSSCTSSTESSRECRKSGGLDYEGQVPAAPRKPLPIPTPRKSKKAVLVRQDGVEEVTREEASETAEEETGRLSLVKSSLFLSSKVFVHTQSVSYSRNSATDQEVFPSSQNLEDAEDELRPPMPPPRQTSLIPDLGRTPVTTTDKLPQEVKSEEIRFDMRAISEMENSLVEEEDEEGGYGNFARYPVTRSLPKRIKLSCNPQLTVAAKAASSEERSPKVAPKKPQRHSLPVSGLLKKELSEENRGCKRDLLLAQVEECQPAEDDGNTLNENNESMKELPATPVEKPSWRFPRAIVPFCGKQASRHGSTGDTHSKPPGSKPGKQRAKSLSTVDLEQADGQKRNSFRKLLELKLSMKMLPRLLAKGSQSLDCTSVEPEPYLDGHWTRADPNSAAVQNQQGPVPNRQNKFPVSTPPDKGVPSPLIGSDQSADGGEVFTGVESTAEYENVPLYEEIPEYMNLPFLNATGVMPHHSAYLGWQNSSSVEDGDGGVYEEQQPYEAHGKYIPCEQQRGVHKSALLEEDAGLDDGHSGDEEVAGSSDEDGDDSSASSKGYREPSGDRQQDAGVKKTKVAHIAAEIVSSEKVFVDVLKMLHIDFRDAVAKASRQSGKPVIEERVLNQILYYLPQLYELNRDLLRELEERVAHWNDHQRLADIFVKKGPYLKMYSTYIREFDRNVALLDEQCRKNSGFAGVVRQFEMSPRCASLALKHYLLKPVQRIPQYQLLLTDYLKNLTEDSSDYKDTQAALSIVKEVANHANDIMKQGDNFQKLMQVQYSLSGYHEIVQPGRVFLKEGTLMKLSRKVMQPRMFFLFNDILLYTTPVQSGQYKLNSMLSLAGMKVSKPSQEAYQNELNIESVERSFILSASSATERDEWLEAISKAIDDYTRKKITFFCSKSQEEAGGAGEDSGAPLGSKAPIWIPDLRTTMCMICTCEFTLTWRRHHCRACGKVVCQSCSSHKHYLEYLKNRPARVCDFCFLKLQRKSDQAESPTPSPSARSPSGAFSSVLGSSRKQKKIPAALKEVSANTENSSMSGYLQRSKGNKKQWKRLWFVIKNKVLYTYAASEDVAALESQPLLGFFLREERSEDAQKVQFKLYHKNTLFYVFKADDSQTAQRWIDAFQEAMVL
ncbi:FYVE, RhoGEF and PH domain-containing protein 6 [Megalops cyprinoides]|uniref:FYVE, RhoGEF and PH domain-containing protein 6 n=1 Tax=Megalops cyprinoides TaxID=118141 RepID=UPI001864E31B|nr:FYVE, RhoGEF and PH domain-containing protein 6 [Megalops cyprinoides]